MPILVVSGPFAVRARSSWTDQELCANPPAFLPLDMNTGAGSSGNPVGRQLFVDLVDQVHAEVLQGEVRVGLPEVGGRPGVPGDPGPGAQAEVGDAGDHDRPVERRCGCGVVVRACALDQRRGCGIANRALQVENGVPGRGGRGDGLASVPDRFLVRTHVHPRHG